MNRDTRLAIYRELAREAGDGILISREISSLTGINATQVRRDLLRAVGAIGARGVGYDAKVLARAITRELKGREAVVRKQAKAQIELLSMVAGR